MQVSRQFQLRSREVARELRPSLGTLAQIPTASKPRRPHRTAIFNVKYSPNLGDGIIAECLEGELRRADPRIDPTSVDLAGRTQFSISNGRHRKALLSVLERLPKPLRSRLVPAVLFTLVRLRQASRWRRELRDCDTVVIGGGALFADADQNFPIKIAQALALASERNMPVAVASVGMSPHWSPGGRRRLSRGLLKARLISASVRDSDSANAWRSILGTAGVTYPKLAPDPGLLSARQYGDPLPHLHPDKRIALCVTAPIALRLHHEEDHLDGHLESWMRTAATSLIARGYQVTLFTNGSPEDRLFRDCLRELMGNAVQVAPDFALPGDLAHFLAGFDCVLAHRLHACIVAYSYQIACVGFAWDKKLKSFFDQTARSRFVIDPREMSPMDLADLALTAIDEGIDPKLHAHLLEQTTTAIHTLARQLLATEAVCAHD